MIYIHENTKSILRAFGTFVREEVLLCTFCRLYKVVIITDCVQQHRKRCCSTNLKQITKYCSILVKVAQKLELGKYRRVEWLERGGVQNVATASYKATLKSPHDYICFRSSRSLFAISKTNTFINTFLWFNCLNTLFTVLLLR